MAASSPDTTVRVPARINDGYLASTIGKKQVMGLAGLGLCGFVLMHMTGNLLIFAGPEAYNRYSYTLIHNPLIYVAELILLAMYVAHVLYALQLTLRNRQASGQRAYRTTAGRKGVSASSRTMIVHGSLLFVFVIFHLLKFKWGTYYQIRYGDLVMRDLFRVVVEEFQNPVLVGAYVLSMAFLCLHLSHGFLSALRTWGADQPRYLPWMRWASWVFAILVGAGFAAQPVYVYFFLKP